MKRLLRIILPLLLLAGAANAVTVPVRSGAHPDFTRLTFRIPEGTGWSLKPEARGAVLKLDLTDVAFEFGDVFARIPRTRVKDIVDPGTGGSIKLHFACDCRATAFVEGGTLLVIDVAERDETDLREVATAKPETAAVRPAVTLPLVIEGDFDARLDLPLRGMGRPLEDDLVKTILRNVDREVLDLANARIGPRSSAALAPYSTPYETLGTTQDNIRVETAIDRDLDSVRRFITPTGDGARTCIEEGQLAVQDWAGEGSFDQQIGPARAALFGEFDRLNAEAVLSLAKLYIHFGFGAEAQAVLNLLPEADRPTLLGTLGLVIDGKSPVFDNTLSGQERCDGPSALWAVLAAGTAGAEADATAVERAFAELPAHLRKHLGPRVATTLTDGGYVDSARRVLRSVDRAGTTESSAAALAEADLAALENAPEIQEEKLLKVVAAQDAEIEAPMALVRLIDKRWAEESSLSDEELELVASYASEYRASGIGPEIARAYVLALALNEDFEAAINLLRTPGEADAAAWGRVQDRVYMLVAERGDDVTFLRHVLDMTPVNRSHLGREVAVKVANRLLSLGFPEEAMAFADRPQDQITRRDRAALLAATALELNRPHRALLELQGLEDAEAQRIRGAALARNGAYLEAGHALLTTPDQDRAARYLWLADAWDELPEDVPGTYGQVAGLSARLTEGEGTLPGTPLADAETLLSQSEAMRATVEALLTAVD
ncbi:hypothetical protein AB9K41_10180 [Cribrihabitans sp. XS_ASV171]